MDKIKFANGDVYDCSFIATIPGGSAFVAISGLSVPEAAAIFSNPEMTQVMECGRNRLVGYTELFAITVQPYGVQANLTGGHDEIIE